MIRTNRPAATALNKVSLKSTVSDNHAVLNTEWQYSSSLYNAYQQNCKKYRKKSCNFHSIHFHVLPGGKFESNTRVAGKLSYIPGIASSEFQYWKALVFVAAERLGCTTKALVQTFFYILSTVITVLS